MNLPLVNTYSIYLHFCFFISYFFHQKFHSFAKFCKFAKSGHKISAYFLYLLLTDSSSLVVPKQGSSILILAGLPSSEPPWIISSNLFHCCFRKLRWDIFLLFFFFIYTCKFNFSTISHYVRSQFSFTTFSICLKAIFVVLLIYLIAVAQLALS